MKRTLVFAMLAMGAAPAWAQQDPLAPKPAGQEAPSAPETSEPSPADQAGSVHDYVPPRAIPRDWRAW